MIEMGKKYQTRDGKPVRILRTDLKGCGCARVIGLVTRPNGTEFVESWTIGGRVIASGVSTEEGDNDLVPVPAKHEGFIVVGKDGFVWGQKIRNTPEDAADDGGYKEGDHIARVTWES